MKVAGISLSIDIIAWSRGWGGVGGGALSGIILSVNITNWSLGKVAGIILSINSTNWSLKKVAGVILSINSINWSLKRADGLIRSINRINWALGKVAGIIPSINSINWSLGKVAGIILSINSINWSLKKVAGNVLSRDIIEFTRKMASCGLAWGRFRLVAPGLFPPLPCGREMSIRFHGRARAIPFRRPLADPQCPAATGRSREMLTRATSSRFMGSIQGLNDARRSDAPPGSLFCSSG